VVFCTRAESPGYRTDVVAKEVEQHVLGAYCVELAMKSNGEGVRGITQEEAKDGSL